MAKSVQPVIEAFLNGKNKKINNTEANNGKLYLFGNMIAKIDLKVGKIMITTCGWNTPTTRDRLNMLPGIWISSKKEQLPAFHGVSKKTGKKVFAWHGKGENQLHFSGEKNWWPEVDRPPVEGVFNYSADNHAIAFKLPSKKVEWDELSLFLNE